MVNNLYIWEYFYQKMDSKKSAQSFYHSSLQMNIWGKHLHVEGPGLFFVGSFHWERDERNDQTPSFLVSSSSSIVCMSMSLCPMAAIATVMETKGGLGINSALKSSFRILSDAKRHAAHWSEGDADNYSLTLSHRQRLTLQTDWQMEEQKNSFHLNHLRE